jgi:arginyl-tRNA synthetase
LEIDVTKATSKNNDNPLYYVQYAHARINQLVNNIKLEKPKSFDLLTTPSEVTLINLLHLYKHSIEVVSTNYEVNKMTLYLTTLAKAFHSFYANNKILDSSNQPLSTQRCYLALAVKQVIKNGLSLLGIVAVDKM